MERGIRGRRGRQKNRVLGNGQRRWRKADRERGGGVEVGGYGCRCREE